MILNTACLGKDCIEVAAPLRRYSFSLCHVAQENQRFDSFNFNDAKPPNRFLAKCTLTHGGSLEIT